MSDREKPDLDAIYRELLAGDKTARERLILASSRIAKECASLVKAKCGDASTEDCDDLASEGVISLIEFLDKIAKERRPVADMPGLLSRVCTCAIMQYVINNKPIGPSARAVQLRRRNGKPDGMPKVGGILQIDREADGFGDASDLLEEIISLCVSSREVEIITAIACDVDEPPTDAELSSKLGCSTKTIERTRAKLRERVESWNEFLGA